MTIGRRRGSGCGCGAWALAGMLVLSAAAHADPQVAPRGARELLIVNASARPIEQLYVSPADTDQWGDDWLTGDDVAPGANYRVRLPRAAGCSVDVQVIYADARREERRAVDLCRTRELAFDGSGATAPEDGVQDHVVALTNRERRPIMQLFLSASDADQWGENRLDADPIEVGRSRDVTFRGGCLADLRVVFDNRAAEERRGLDLCGQPGIIIRPGWTTDEQVPGRGGSPAPTVGSAGRMDPVIVTVMVDNRTGYPVRALTMRPEDPVATSALARDQAPSETHDLLGGDVLPVGGHVVMPVARGSFCHYTVHLVHGPGIADQDVPGFDLCVMRSLVLPPAAAGR